MNVQRNTVKGISIAKVFVHVRRSQDRWTKPNQWIVSVINAAKGSIVTVQERMWRGVPKALLGKVLEMERRIKDLFESGDICIFEDESENEGGYAEISVDGKKWMAKIYIEQVNEMLRKRGLSDEKIGETIAILNERSERGMSRDDAKLVLRSKIEEGFAQWATGLLDSEISGPPYVIEQDF